MKRFMTTKFIQSIQDTVLDSDVKILNKRYDEFALFIFSERSNFINNDAYHNALLYTRVELSDLERNIEISKNEFLRKTIELIDDQIIWLREQIIADQNLLYCPLMRKSKKNNNLQWTGTQVEFVELVYSLNDAGSINNGNISLKEQFALMGETFNLQIKDYYRYFNDITHRTGDCTIYLNKLKRVLMQHLLRSGNR